MIYRFDPNATYIAIETLIVGPTAFGRAVFALDTGATQTGIDKEILKLLGFDSTNALSHFSIASVKGLIPSSEYRLPVLSALGVDETDFDVASIDISFMSFDGVLGKDFFRDKILTIDFRHGTIELT